jgi:anti-anti-sigma regulatory factor
MLKIQRTTGRAAIVLTVSGRLDAENVSELCESLDAISSGAAVVLDLADLVLADRDVIRLLRTLEASKRIVLRNCPAYVRIWMAAEDHLQ